MKTLETWTDVDGALEEMGRTDLDIAEAEADLGRKLYDLIDIYTAKLSPLRAKRNELESDIAGYCLLKKQEFAKKRSRQFTFGKIAFRVTEKLEIPNGLEAAAVATVKRLGFGDCVEIKERLDKSALRRLSDGDLAKCGVRRIREDHFRIEPNLDFVSEETGRSLASRVVTVDMDRLSGAVKIRETDACQGGGK